ncbi:MAG: hypothetical protein HYW69_01145 [Candidatus Nealsonbacteria bacterium]|nr:hypothetical protein [Candidatus Nealsonbacteria bacterium]
MLDYISLKEASKYCNYSQDYLKLRARQGKFKAIKIGRNWVTTTEWIKEYIGRDRVAPPGGATGCSTRWSNQWFNLPTLIIGLGLAAYLVFLLFDLGYFELNINGFLANIGSLIPSRVVEIR